MSPEEHQTHVRENASILAHAERRALLWMAKRLPHFVHSDHLTLLGLGAMLLAGMSYWAASKNRLALVMVILALALNWFGDSLDGTLARVRKQLRPRYGWYVDHVTDIVGNFFLLGGMALSGYLSPLVALGLLAAFLMVEAEIFLATHALGAFRPAFLRIGPTELRIVLATGTLVLLYKPWVHICGLGPYRLFDVGGTVAIVGLAAALIVSAIGNTRSLYRAERLPR
jgi:archaetidylinositol phosphate synthase